MHATYTQLWNIAVAYISEILVTFTNIFFHKWELNFSMSVMLVKDIQPCIACVLFMWQQIVIRQCHVYTDPWEAS